MLCPLRGTLNAWGGMGRPGVGVGMVARSARGVWKQKGEA